ncbi:penicillin-binding transpeptidase domain-containing protein [Salinithrix halophila]|uniref:Penicillin-binding transpeptidase domain-containing protein n=1 Tax=Salinithrix halophila TaxID=1485204 RepID=A0ABV8JI73_9BACL
MEEQKKRIVEWFRRFKINKKTALISLSVVLVTGVAGVVYATQDSGPGPKTVMNRYIDYWEQGKYDSMYNLLSNESKQKVKKKAFVKRHKAIAEGIQQKDIQFKFAQTHEEEPESIPFTTHIQSGIVRDISFKNKAHLVEDDEGWRVDWSPSLIFPELKESDRIRVTPTPPGKRGEITARNGEPLAVNDEKTAVGVIPNQVKDLKATSQKLAKALDLSAKEVYNKVKSGEKKPEEFVTVRTFSGKDQAKAGKLEKAIPGVMARDASVRRYPQKELTAHVTGYIRPITKDQLKKQKKEGYQAGDWIGQSGLEKYMEETLRGEPGYRIVTTDAHGKEKSLIAKKPPKNGKDIQTTIDLKTQKQMVSAIQRKSTDKGGGVALDPKNGDILAMVSAPSYDPNTFIKGMSRSDWAQISSSSQPLANRAKVTYAPGSTMKAITSAIGLDSKKITPKTHYNTDSGKWQKDSSWGGYFVRRVDNPGGGVDLAKALAWSDNIYFARVGLKIGGPTMIKYLKQFGFDEKMDIPLDVTPSQYSNDKKFQSEIQLADTSYGQGQLLISPIHLATMYNTFANDGDMLKPRILMKDDTTNKPKIWKKDVISPKVSAKVRELLTGVVTKPKGSARDLRTPGVSLGAKTGTAELKASRDDKYQRQLGWLAWMAGKDKDDKPDIVCAAFVDEVQDRGGSHYLFPGVKKMIKARYR